MPSSGGSRAAHPEQIASFALLSMAPPANAEIRVNFKTDNSSCALCSNKRRYDAAGFKSLDKYAKGPMASPIAAGLFDVDVHDIPARPGEPEHRHYDARVLFRASSLVIRPGDGVKGARWVPLAELGEIGTDESVLRAVRKLPR